LILSAAAAAGCRLPISEDLQDGFTLPSIRRQSVSIANTGPVASHLGMTPSVPSATTA
jgi:hypothetical protein